MRCADCGRMCGETELNLALIELVKALGHSHRLVCGTAYLEVVVEHLLLVHPWLTSV